MKLNAHKNMRAQRCPNFYLMFKKWCIEHEQIETKERKQRIVCWYINLYL